MKTKQLFGTAVLAILVSACSQELIEKPYIEVQDPEMQEMTFTASCNDWTPETRTIRQPDGKVYWDVGEKIGILPAGYSSYGGYTFYSLNNKPQPTAVFAGTLYSSVGTYWGLYPYSSDAYLYQSDYIVTGLAEEQKGVAGTFPNNLYVAVARTSTQNLAFSHPLGGIKFSVTQSGVSKAILVSNTKTPFAAEEMLIQYKDGTANVVDYAGTTSTLYLTPEGGTFVPGEAYYFVSMPGEHTSGFTLVLLKTDGAALFRNVDKPVTISRAKFMTLMNADEGYTYNKSPLSFSPDVVSLGARGGTMSISVDYLGEYHVDASSCDWISEMSVKPVDIGKYDYNFKVEANPGAERVGVITVCDESNCYPVTITQASGANLKTVAHHSLGMRFTATWCGWCPRMNGSFAMAKEVLGDKFTIVNFHASSSDLPFAKTGILCSQYEVGGYPTGIVDGRRLIQNYSQSYASSLIQKVVAETEELYPSVTSAGISSTVKGRSVESEVKVFVAEPGEYKLTVLLLEDGIVGYQADFENGAHQDYQHDNIARVLVNGTATGDKFSVSEPNHISTFNFTTSVPDGYDISKMKLLVYVQRQFGFQAALQDGNYGDYYIDNCRVAQLGASVEPEVQ